MSKVGERSPGNWLRSAFWRTAGMATVYGLGSWVRSLHCRITDYGPGVDPVRSDYAGPAIFLFWHEYMMVPLYLRGCSRMAMLLSQHQDAELLYQVARFFGTETIRGSSTRGGTAAILQFLRRRENFNLAITPDGPRGPRRQLASGCIYLSSRLQMPLILLGIGYDRPWRVRQAWDQFALPRPGSHARLIMSQRIHIPHNLHVDEIEEHRVRVEHMLNAITCEAEAWALDRQDRRRSRAMYRTPVVKSRPLAHHRQNGSDYASGSESEPQLGSVGQARVRRVG